jgi:sterol desaturase/sphingolipid hydroxylase (fatty acid hydroxylase superfamily)
MHRIHHSVILRELSSDFGFNLSWWDPLLGTYREQPEKGQNEMPLGLAQFRDPDKLALPRLLLFPLTGASERPPTGR